MRNTSWLKGCALGVSAALLLGPAAAAAPTDNDKKRARRATRYLVSEQRADGAIVAFSEIGSTADAILGFVAARRAPRAITRAVRYLRNNADAVDNIGEVAKVHLALVAAGRQPTLGDRNLTEEILAAQTLDGAYGDDSHNDQVSSHALAMLALASSGAPADAKAVKWLVDAQCANGGWQFDSPAGEGDDANCHDGTENDFTTADSNTTSYAVQALATIPTPNGTPKTDPFAFLDSFRDPVKGGWGYTNTFTLTDANSTALVIQAYVAEDKALPAGAKAALKKLQYPFCSKKKGAFAYSWFDANGDGRYTKNERTGPDVGATSQAIPALFERALPLAPATVTKGAPKRKHC
jgi:hypothetical protein